MNRFGLTLVALVSMILIIGGREEHSDNDIRKNMNEIIGHIFRDYCRSYGGITKIFNAEVVIEGIDPEKPTFYMGCINSPDSGVLVLQDDGVVYYVPEGQEYSSK